MAPGNFEAVPGSSADEAEQTPSNSKDSKELSLCSRVLQHRPKESLGRGAGTKLIGDTGDDGPSGKVVIEVQVPLPERPWEYLRIPEMGTVKAVIEEVEHSDNGLWYRVAFEDGREEDVSGLGSNRTIGPKLCYCPSLCCSP